MHQRLGEMLENLCRNGRNEAILVAPFIKRATLSRLFAVLPISIHLHCITRWRPEEIAANVSDPDIWLDIKHRVNASLRLCPSLHAKYYRVDDTCFIGSANLTDTALGWNSTPNLEILCTYANGVSECQIFERELLSLSVLCEEVIYQEMIATVALLKKEISQFQEIQNNTSNQMIAENTGVYSSESVVNTNHHSLNSWLPQSRQPGDIYLAYSKILSNYTTDSRNAALADLAMLQIPLGYSQPLFNRYVAIQLLQIPCILAVDSFVSNSQRFGAVAAFLNTLPCSHSTNFNANNAWQTLMRWLLYFLPDRYERTVPNYSEVFQVKAKKQIYP